MGVLACYVGVCKGDARVDAEELGARDEPRAFEGVARVVGDGGGARRVHAEASQGVEHACEPQDGGWLWRVA